MKQDLKSDSIFLIGMAELPLGPVVKLGAAGCWGQHHSPFRPDPSLTPRSPRLPLGVAPSASVVCAVRETILGWLQSATLLSSSCTFVEPSLFVELPCSLSPFGWGGGGRRRGLGRKVLRPGGLALALHTASRRQTRALGPVASGARSWVSQAGSLKDAIGLLLSSWTLLPSLLLTSLKNCILLLILSGGCVALFLKYFEKEKKSKVSFVAPTKVPTSYSGTHRDCAFLSVWAP